MSEHLELEHEADVGAARRRFGVLAARAGLDEARAHDAALIASELAANVIRHAQHGGVVMTTLEGGVSIAAWDRGRGMNVEACLRDGMSTAGTAGVGLGAVSRLATSWDAYAPAGQGSVVTATILPRAAAAATPVFAAAGVCLPYPGLEISGDAWAWHTRGDTATAIVADGLGHGDGAADASAAVLAAFRLRPDDAPAAILDRAHTAARATRGAAATVVRVDRAAQTATVAGVGNVAAWIVGAAQKQLVTQHGTLGHAAPRLREESQPFPAGSLLVMCSDGLKSRIDFAEHAGLASRDPATIACVLWRDHRRGRDDATAVVLREAR